MLHIYLLALVQIFGCKEFNQPDVVIHERPKPVIVKNYFRSPVDHTFKIAGTFCELRPNHFHTGIDIKSSNGVQGDNIYAIADGYISRIGISPTGYGYALYITHKNGFTSVYGHLKSYSPEILKFALAEQERQERFDIQYYPDSTLIPVKKGQIIGYMGNSGSSNGAHLHFEIRETDSETPINPLLFGFNSQDSMKPGISYARIYDLDDEFNEYNAKNLMVKKRGNLFVPTLGDTITTLSPTIGLGINTRDGQEGNWNKNGVYSIKLLVNDSLTYYIKMDSISFEKTRMINAHIDYPEQRLKRNYVHKCYSLPGNTLPIIQYQQLRGLISLNELERKKITFIVSDYNNNISEMTFFVKRNIGNPNFIKPLYNYIVPYNKATFIQDSGIHIFFTDKTFFKNQFLTFSKKVNLNKSIYSAVYDIANPDIPVYNYYNCKILANGIPQHLKNKSFIAGIEGVNQITNWGGTWEGEWLNAPVRTCGTFFIAVDTIPPSIVPLIFSKNLTRTSRIVFKIDDNILPAGQTPYLNYKAYINDKYIPMEYDLKTKTIDYVFPKGFQKGTYTFRLEVFDALNNTKVYSATFIK